MASPQWLLVLVLFTYTYAPVMGHRAMLQEVPTTDPYAAAAAAAAADPTAVAAATQSPIEPEGLYGPRVPGPLHLDPAQHGRGPGGFYR